MPLFRCPTCQREFQAESSQAMPFCSERCRLIDLGRWLDEKQKVPHERRDEEGEELATDSGES